MDNKNGARLKQILPAEVKPFSEAMKQRRFLLMRCSECGFIRIPYGVVCPECLAMTFDWLEASGRGTIYSYVVFRRAFHSSVETILPYIVAQVRLLEGPLYLSNIIDCAPDMIHCELKVSLRWEPTETGYLPVFAPLRCADNMKRSIHDGDSW